MLLAENQNYDNTVNTCGFSGARDDPPEPWTRPEGVELGLWRLDELAVGVEMPRRVERFCVFSPNLFTRQKLARHTIYATNVRQMSDSRLCASS